MPIVSLCVAGSLRFQLPWPNVESQCRFNNVVLQDIHISCHLGTNVPNDVSVILTAEKFFVHST